MGDWEEKNYKLTRTFLFRDFKESMSFINKVAELAEKVNHHPDIFISYNKVSLMLSTHDAGDKVTDKDRSLAENIDKLTV